MLYLQYIDYIFNIWKGTDNKVLKKRNKQHPTAKFDLKISKLLFQIQKFILMVIKISKLPFDEEEAREISK